MPESTIDTTLALLASRRRRLALRQLRDAGGEWVPATALADRIVERSADDAATRRSVRIELHHSVLPKLGDADVVDYDPALGRARYCGGPDDEFVDRLLGLTETLRP